MKTGKVLIIIFIITMLILSCKKGEKGTVSKSISDGYIVNTNTKDKSGNNQNISDESAGSVNKNEIKKDVIEQKKIITGSINYTVDELTKIDNKVNNAVKLYGGYISNSVLNNNSLTLELKIPADKFDTFLDTAGNFGTITSKNIKVEDVTLSFYDMESRIKTKKILQDRYTSYLKVANNIEEMLKIESSLNSVTEEIESMQATFKNMEFLISYCTLTLNFTKPGIDQFARNFPSLKNGFEDLAYNFTGFLYNLLFFILYILLYGIPIIIFIGLFYYILFGKISLFRKIYYVLSKKKE